MTKVPRPALTRIKREHPTNRDKTMQHCIQADSRNAKYSACYTSLRPWASAPYAGECSASCSVAFCSVAPQGGSSFSMEQGACGR
jgi:hypothetical protein